MFINDEDMGGTPPCLSVLSDEELFGRFKAGKQDTLEELFGRYQRPGFRVAYRMLHNEAKAEDAVQEGWVKILTGLQGFKGRSSLKTWLLHVFRNAARDILRQEGRQANRVGDAREQYALAQRTEETRTILHELMEQEQQAGAKARDETIRLILEEHGSERMRSVYSMLSREMPNSLIAKEMGIGVRAVQWNVARIRKILIEKMPSWGYSIR